MLPTYIQGLDSARRQQQSLEAESAKGMYGNALREKKNNPFAIQSIFAVFTNLYYGFAHFNLQNMLSSSLFPRYRHFKHSRRIEHSLSENK
jgi:hypothetical protein